MDAVNPLDELTERLEAAAADPPKLTVTKVITPNPRPILPPRTSTGSRRPVLRSSQVQRAQVQDRTVTEAKDDARRTLVAQAKKGLTG